MGRNSGDLLDLAEGASRLGLIEEYNERVKLNDTIFLRLHYS